MPYVLGVHLGATTTSAAVMRRDGDRWAMAAPVPLGTAAPTVPTMLCLAQDGSYLAGEDARRQEVAHHEWVAGYFLGHLGEDAPLVVGGEFVPAHRLAAHMVEWVADQVAHRQGQPAEHIAVTHSAGWGPHRTHLLHQELARLGLSDVTLLPEPVAVGLDYSTRQQVSEGGTLVVGNVGGSGADATVLRRHASGGTPPGSDRPGSPPAGFEIVGSALESEHPGGGALDDEILAHLRTELGDELDRLDPAEPEDRAAALRLRAECARAKEALSHQPATHLRVELPRLSTQVELHRTRYEQLARPHLERVPDLLAQVVHSAALSLEDLDAIVLAGGTARVPLLRQLVVQRFADNPDPARQSVEQPHPKQGDAVHPQVDSAPELVAARGAATCAANVVSGAGRPAASAVEETSVLMPVATPGLDDVEPIEESPGTGGPGHAGGTSGKAAEPPRPPVEVESLHVEPPPKNRTLKVVKLVLAAALIIFGLVMTFVQGFDSGSNARPGILRQVGQ